MSRFYGRAAGAFGSRRLGSVYGGGGPLTDNIGTPVYLGNFSSITSANTVAMTLAQPVPAGALIVVTAEVDSATRTITGVIDSGSNTYAKAVDENHATAGKHLYQWYAMNATAMAAGQSITAQLSTIATSRRAIEAWCVTGVLTAGALDKIAVGQGTGTALAAASTGALSQAGEISFSSFLTADTGTALTSTEGGSGAAFLTGAGRMATFWKQRDTTDAVVATAATGNAAWLAATATYKGVLS